MSDAKPTVGRIVHVRSARDWRAAIITDVSWTTDDGEVVCLTVFERDGTRHGIWAVHEDQRRAASADRAIWRWPPRE